MALSYANSKTRDQALESLVDAALSPAGAFTGAQAWDDHARRWAYPDQVLMDFGMTVLAFGDTGGHGFAISASGIYLSSNGHARKVEDIDALLDEYRRRGFIGKRLGA